MSNAAPPPSAGRKSKAPAISNPAPDLVVRSLQMLASAAQQQGKQVQLPAGVLPPAAQGDKSPVAGDSGDCPLVTAISETNPELAGAIRPASDPTAQLQTKLWENASHKRPPQPTNRAGYRMRNPRLPQPVGKVMQPIFAADQYREPMLRAMVFEQWDLLVGPEIAAHTEVMKVTADTVVVSCSSTAWATNLRYMQSQILQSIAGRIGANRITKLRIYGPQTPSWRHGPRHVKGRGPRDTYG